SNAGNGMAMVAAPSVSGPAAVKVMHARHEGMETIGKDFKALHREFDSPTPNLALVRTAAGEITGLSREASGWFPAGTGPEVGKTGAKPAIWQNPKDFADKLSAFQRAAAAFNATTTRDDVGAMKSRYADLANTCMACHDKYRSEMHHDHCHAAGLGPSRPACPLADCRADRLQLVVGPPPSHRLAHLV